MPEPALPWPHQGICFLPPFSGTRSAEKSTKDPPRSPESKQPVCIGRKSTSIECQLWNNVDRKHKEPAKRQRSISGCALIRSTNNRQGAVNSAVQFPPLQMATRLSTLGVLEPAAKTSSANKQDVLLTAATRTPNMSGTVLVAALEPPLMSRLPQLLYILSSLLGKRPIKGSMPNQGPSYQWMSLPRRHDFLSRLSKLPREMGQKVRRHQTQLKRRSTCLFSFVTAMRGD